MNEKELLKKIEILLETKDKAIKNGQYEYAAMLRDEIRKYTDLLEDFRSSE